MNDIFLDPQFKPQGFKPKALMAFTSAFARLSPEYSANFALKYLFKPYSRRSYEFRTHTPPHETHSLKTIKGNVTLHHFLAESDEHVLLSHGWADTSVRFTYLINELLDQGVNVWTLDQIGHGKSEGDTAHLFGFIDGVKESLNHIAKNNFKVTSLLGHSMGALAILNQADEILKNKKIILMSAPTKFFENLFINTKKAGVSNLMLLNALNKVSKVYNTKWTELSPDKLTHKINKNFLMIHDQTDPTCSYDNFKNLIKGTEHSFVSTKGLGHLKLLKDKGVLGEISSFIKS